MSDLAPARRDDPGQILSRNRRLASAVLVAMIAVYGLTHLSGQPGASVMLLRSMAEAGMIGGLADWFAVTALFRHPLGLPIPHTALLPRNQAKAARNVGRFFETHFLAPDQVEARLRDIRPSRHIAHWLAGRGNAHLLAGQVSDLIAALARHEPSPRNLVRIRVWLRGQDLRLGSDEAIAGTVANLAKTGMRGSLSVTILDLVRREIAANRDLAVSLVQQHSRWWIANSVDRRVAQLAVNAVLSVLDDLTSEDSRLRGQFELAFDHMVDALLRDGGLARAVSEGRMHLNRSGASEAALATLMRAARDQLSRRLQDDPDSLAEPMAILVRDLSAKLLADPDTSAALHARLAQMAGRIVGESRPQIAAYVSDVIAGWEPEELNRRFEEEIGPDLQFIRINGALLGSLIGGILFGLEILIA